MAVRTTHPSSDLDEHTLCPATVTCYFRLTLMRVVHASLQVLCLLCELAVQGLLSQRIVPEASAGPARASHAIINPHLSVSAYHRSFLLQAGNAMLVPVQPW